MKRQRIDLIAPRFRVLQCKYKIRVIKLIIEVYFKFGVVQDRLQQACLRLLDKQRKYQDIAEQEAYNKIGCQAHVRSERGYLSRHYRKLAWRYIIIKVLSLGLAKTRSYGLYR